MRAFSVGFWMFMAVAGLAADPSIEVPKTNDLYVPVVVKLKDVTKGTQAVWKITPKPAWQESVGSGVRFTGPPGTYNLNVVHVDFDARTFGQMDGVTTIVGAGPTPTPPPTPPGPQPDPEPDPPPVPDETKLPFPATGFYAMFITQDTDANAYTAAQRGTVNGAAVAIYLNLKTTTSDVDSQPAWRIFEPEQQFIGEGTWKEAHKKAVADWRAWEQKNGKKTPWLICGNGTKGFSGPVTTTEETLATLQKYGG